MKLPLRSLSRVPLRVLRVSARSCERESRATGGPSLSAVSGFRNAIAVLSHPARPLHPLSSRFAAILHPPQDAASS